MRASERSKSQAACDKGRQRSAGLGVRQGAPYGPQDQSPTISARAFRRAASPSGQETSLRLRRLAKPFAASSAGPRRARRIRLPIDAPLTLFVRVARNATDRIVRPKPSTYRERKQCTEHTHRAGRRAAAAGDAQALCLPVLMRAVVTPSLTASRKRSMSCGVTAATFNAPKSGFMCLSICPLSPSSVLAFFVV